MVDEIWDSIWLPNMSFKLIFNLIHKMFLSLIGVQFEFIILRLNLDRFYQIVSQFDYGFQMNQFEFQSDLQFEKLDPD